MENALMIALQISLGITAVALVVLAFLLASRSQKQTMLIGGQPVFPPSHKKSSKPKGPRIVGGFRLLQKVTFIEPKAGRQEGHIIRFKGFRRAFVICTDSVPRRVKISRLAAA